MTAIEAATNICCKHRMPISIILFIGDKPKLLRIAMLSSGLENVSASLVGATASQEAANLPMQEITRALPAEAALMRMLGNASPWSKASNSYLS